MKMRMMMGATAFHILLEVSESLISDTFYYVRGEGELASRLRTCAWSQHWTHSRSEDQPLVVRLLVS